MDELQEATARLKAAEEVLHAIRSDEVDALVVSTKEEGDRVFTLTGAEHPYRVMVETMNEGAVTLAPDGTILYCNHRFADIVKASRKKVIGSSIYQYVSAKDRQLFEALIERGLKDRSKTELALQTCAENSAPVLVSASPLQHMDMPGAVCMVVTDLSELKRNEAMLAEEKLTTQILLQAAEIFVICDHQGRIIRASQSTNRLLGRSPLTQAFDEAFQLSCPDGTPFVLLSVLRDKFFQALEVTFMSGDNKPLYFLLRANSFVAYQGAIGFIVVMVDITERKKMDQALQKAHNELEQQVEERTVELQSALSEIKRMKDQLEAENIYFRHEHKMKHRFEHIIGKSDGLKYILYRAEQVAPMNTTVLILGETGTGKELIAAAIHNLSPRKERPLISVNCAALPANLIESELFGREKGAFTGADIRRIGRFEVANGSTFCLDEIGELPLEIQSKLLRVIQHSEFERLGSSHTIKVDVRIVATTNRDLEEEVRKGRFRQDLYYRLNVFPITVPPLRQRKEDIPLMVEVFVERYARKFRKEITSIPKETMKTLQDYPWPGNVRELESIIERAVILCPGPSLHLADKLEPLTLSSSTMRTLEETERNQILKILSETSWRIEGKDGAAAILGINPSTLRARMHKLEIVRPGTKESD
ncbi:MAG: sigma 54-interacting transcriptional regulator [Deltaproteobacteria bacterium]|nr:sigma 54-interacting transcriptional regulator [Deltaproteobacteria bacterium]